MQLSPELKKKLRPFVDLIRISIIERFFLRKIKQIISSQKPFSIDPKMKKVIFNTQYATTYTWIEYLLAHKLRKRGHQTDFLICDGLAYCEQETITTKRPSCCLLYTSPSPRDG